MILALIAPEAVVGWALRQRLAAAELAKEHKGDGWTLTHGFFAIMGGFMEYEGNQPIRVLLPDELESYSLTGNGDSPRLSKAEIDDKSKGDAISKGVVILQTGWFVTQCIARGLQGLPITELELATVAFATLNLIIYVLWWDKPQNVQRGVRVYKKRITESPIDDGDAEETIGFWVAFQDALSDIPSATVRGPVLGEFKDSHWLIRVLLWSLVKPVDILLPDDEEDIKFEKRVNTFYPARWATSSQNTLLLLVVAITLVFGAIHCLGWSFDFPSSLEKTLWRAASLSIIAVPIVIVPFTVLGGLLDKCLPNDRFDDFYMRMTMTLLSFLYVLGRLALLILPFLCLRSLPPAAFHVVHWASLIPHV